MPTTNLLIRPYLESDEPAVISLWAAAFPNEPAQNVPADDIRRKLAVQRELFLVGEVEGLVVATVMAGFDGHRGWVYRVAVLPEFQKRGIGQAMMVETEKRLAAIGCTKINLQVRATNDGVVAFYRSLGFEVEERISMGKGLGGEVAIGPSVHRGWCRMLPHATCADLRIVKRRAFLLTPACQRIKLTGMAKPLAKLISMLTPKRRWAQFSLATMFVVVTGLCVWLAVVVNRAQRQRDAVASIEALGGRVGYAKISQAGETFPSPFLRRWLPRDYLDGVQQVSFNDTQVTDAGLAHLHGLTTLESLYLDNTQVTDAGLAHLQGLTGMRLLLLDRTQVTDAGLAHLQGLTELQQLLLSCTHVTGAGLAHLRGLMGLQTISLQGAQVTDAGLAHLQGLTGLATLYLGYTQVTDAGLAHLQGLTGLQMLVLCDTQVTDAGLAHLHGLTGLQTLILDNTQVTDGGVAKLRKALPKCQVYWP